jgi:hypothetical protein
MSSTYSTLLSEKACKYKFPIGFYQQQVSVRDLCELKSQTLNYVEYFSKNNPDIQRGLPKNIEDWIEKMTYLYNEREKMVIKNGVIHMVTIEKLLSPKYYTVYHGCPRASYFLMEIETIFYCIMQRRDVNSVLFRSKDNTWRYDNKPVNDMSSFKEYIVHNVKQNKPTNIRSILRNPENLINGVANSKNREYNLDHYNFYKKLGISVNLSIMGGKSGENTFEYFIDEVSNTSPNAIFNLINIMIDHYFPESTGSWRTLAKFRIRQFYDQNYTVKNSNNYYGTENKSDSVLIQINIKKEIVDDVLYISTPYGYPIDIPAHEILEYYQRGEFPSLFARIDSYNLSSDRKFKKTFIPDIKNDRTSVKTFNNWFGSVGDYILSSFPRGDVTNLQGRLVTANQELFLEKDNFVIKTFDKSGFDHSNRFFELYMLILYTLGESQILDKKTK